MYFLDRRFNQPPSHNFFLSNERTVKIHINTYIKFIIPIFFKLKNKKIYVYRYRYVFQVLQSTFHPKMLSTTKTFKKICVCIFKKRKKNMNDYTKHKNNDRKRIKKDMNCVIPKKMCLANK